MSYVRRGEDGSLVGEGVAFKILEFLTDKFNFTYELVNLTSNIIGSSEDKEGIVKVFESKVRLNRAK